VDNQANLLHAQAGCSIVIRAYNEEKNIGRLLMGINQQTIKDEVEVILVDSGSRDRTVTIARAAHWPFPVQVLHVQPEEFTFGYALNRGIEVAHNAQIIIASAHVYPVYPDWLERLLAPFQDPQVGLVYGKQRGNQTTRFSEHQIFAHWFPEQTNLRQSHPFCNNANAAIRRSLWDVHPYDESLTGLEDLEWAKWAMEAGYSIAYVSEAEIIHVHEDTPNGVYNRYRREAMAFKRLFPHEHFTLWDFWRLMIRNLTNDLKQAAQERRIFANLGSIFWFRVMQFWGTYQGFHRSGPLTWQLRQTFYYPHGTLPARQSMKRDVEPIEYNDLA
jgi:glycosyltransferase involved in cell wall biosynthesis